MEILFTCFNLNINVIFLARDGAGELSAVSTIRIVSSVKINCINMIGVIFFFKIEIPSNTVSFFTCCFIGKPDAEIRSAISSESFIFIVFIIPLNTYNTICSLKIILQPCKFWVSIQSK